VNAPLTPLWYDSVIESVFVKGLGARLTPALVAELEQVGISLSKRQPAVPVPVVRRGLEVVHRHLYPALTFDEALLELGRLSMRGYTETLLGRALLRVMQLIGTQRSIIRTTISMRSGNNYLMTEPKVVSDTCIELTFNDVSGMTAFYRGLLEEGARLTQVKNFRIETLPALRPSAVFRLEWDE
jgi:uncharacterized protein (TIGR02265 family)